MASPPLEAAPGTGRSPRITVFIRRLTALPFWRFVAAVCYSMRISTLVIAAVSLSAPSVSAQCRPPKDSHEARLLAFYAAPIVFSAGPGAIGLPPGAVRLSGEGVFVPTPGADIQRTSYCYAGKPNHTNLTSFFGRPRLAVGLPYGFGVELSYLPPITFADATPNLFWGALSFNRAVRDNLDVTLRAHVTSGVVYGPITCPKSALQQSDATQPCYGTTPSHDAFRPHMYGGELVAAFHPGGRDSRVQLTGGLGANALRPRFRVDFTNSLGVTDNTAIAVDLTRFTGFAAATVKITARCDVSAEGYASFGDLATVRGLVGCRLLH